MISSRQQTTEFAGFKKRVKGAHKGKKKLKLKVGFQVNYSLYSKGLRLEFTTILIFSNTGNKKFVSYLLVFVVRKFEVFLLVVILLKI